MWPAVKLHFEQEPFRKYVEQQQFLRWRPSKIVWHNTAAPSLAQWIKSANEDRAKGQVPGITRIRSLEYFFKSINHWPGCPHLFVANDFIWVMNPLIAPGTHSPSFNKNSIGIEMIGDFSKEDDDFGEGLRVRKNTIFATSILCNTLGLDPQESIVLHKSDPETTHDCPGKDVADDYMQMIREVEALESGGDHNPEDIANIIGGVVVPSTYIDWIGRTTTGGLNFRKGPGAVNESIGELPKGLIITVTDEAKNGTTVWLRAKTPAGYTGWVSGKYVERIRI